MPYKLLTLTAYNGGMKINFAKSAKSFRQYFIKTLAMEIKMIAEANRIWTSRVSTFMQKLISLLKDQISRTRFSGDKETFYDVIMHRNVHDIIFKNCK